MKVSIIIPIFNDQEYIQTCLDTVCNQSYKDIEVICVDDNSSDKSLVEIKDYANKDSRVKYISFHSNQGAYIARKRGVEQAIGEYILFVDADDYLDSGLIEELLEIEKKRKCDILHFSSEIVNCGVPGHRIEEMQTFVSPLYKELFDEEIFNECFCKDAYGFNIWNKCFKAELCREVFSKLPEMNIPKANDAFMYYFLSANAHSYFGQKTQNTYHYCFGNGNTGEQNITKEGFDRYCHYKSFIDFMDQYNVLKPKGMEKSIALDKLKKRLIQDALETWIFQVREEDKADTLKCLVSAWDIVDIMGNLHDVYSAFMCEFSKYVIEGNILGSNSSASRKIGVYYYSYSGGGVERVISVLIPLFIESNYEVILITEDEKSEDDYSLPEQVRRYTIPRRGDVSVRKVKYGERARKLIEILKKEGIDTLCYHAAENELLFYDLFITKYMGVKFLLTKHGFYSQHLFCNRDFLNREMAVYPLADALTVLSYEEEVFWRTLGIKSFLITDPIQPMDTTSRMHNEESNEIVWVGRLARIQKQYQDIVPIMQKVVEKIPEAVIRVYGKPETYKDKFLLEEQIKQAGLKEHVKYMGFSKDLEEIYGNARGVLVTSAYEAFSTVILESKQFGIPVVTYSMPYLEILKDKKGVREVEQGDIISASREVIEILSNRKLHTQLSAEARESIKDFSNQEIMKRWNQLFRGQAIGGASRQEKNVYGDIIRTMVSGHRLGCAKYNKLNQKYLMVQDRFKQEQVKKIISERHLKVAVYPYGVRGKKLCEQFGLAGIEVSLIIDNKWKGRAENIISITDLKEYSVTEYLFVISSENINSYQEIRKEIYSAVPKENVYDWYPLDGE